MIGIFTVIGDKLLNITRGNDIEKAYDDFYELRDTINLELSNMRSVELMLQFFAKDNWDEDPIVRTKNVAKGKYDYYVGDWPLFKTYKEMCGLLVTKFGL